MYGAYGHSTDDNDVEKQFEINGSNQFEEEDSFSLTHEQGFFSNWLDSSFHISRRGSTIGREIRAGTATFLTMSYIVIVNARVAGGSSGIPNSDVMIGTALSSAIASIVCGYFGNLPFALAPGLGLSAYISVGLTNHASRQHLISSKHTLVQEYEEWQTALAACAIAGVIQMFMANRLSSYLMKGTPRAVQVGTVVGMGLLIAFVALQQIGFVQKAPNTTVAFRASNSTLQRDGGPLVELGENAYSLETLLACFGLLTVTFLSHHDIQGSVLIAVGLNTLISILLLGTNPPEAVFAFPHPQKAFLGWDFLHLSLVRHVPVILAFILVGVFDVAGVLIGLSHVMKIDVNENGIPNGSAWAFFAAGLGTFIGAMFGSTPVIVHLESAAGLTEGGRTGLSACVCGIWFLLCLFTGPLLDSVPPCATSPVLFFVGSLMMGQLATLDWHNPAHSIPAFTTLTIIPFTFSVPNGVFFGALMSSTFVLFEGIAKKCMKRN